jgi:hypothetical protein
MKRIVLWGITMMKFFSSSALAEPYIQSILHRDDGTFPSNYETLLIFILQASDPGNANLVGTIEKK